jgi:hypothetical protein
MALPPGLASRRRLASPYAHLFCLGLCPWSGLRPKRASRCYLSQLPVKILEGKAHTKGLARMKCETLRRGKPSPRSQPRRQAVTNTSTLAVAVLPGGAVVYLECVIIGGGSRTRGATLQELISDRADQDHGPHYRKV